MHHFQTILFDLDGTLLDSGEGIINCARLALEHFSIPIPPPEEMRTFVGPPLRDSMIRHGVREADADEAVKVFRSRYTTVGKFETAPYPGIQKMLTELKSRGCKLYVATSKPEKLALEILEHFGLLAFFDCVAGATMDNSRTSKSDVIAYLKSRVGDVKRAVMVGDTTFDILGAAEHRLPAVGVAWGYGSSEDMKAAGAMAIAEDAAHLTKLLCGETEETACGRKENPCGTTQN